MPYQQTTLLTLRARLRDRTESVPFWTDTEATSGLNEGLKLWNLFTGQWRTPVSIGTTPASDPYIALPGPLLWPARLLWNGGPLVKTSRSALDQAHPGWQTAAGTPKFWSPVSLGLIALYPRDASGIGVLTADGVADTPVLIADGDYVDLSEAQLQALTGYGLYYLAYKRPGWRAFLPLWQAFLRTAGQQNALFRASSFYRTAMLGDPQQKARPRRQPDPPPSLPQEADDDA